MLMRRVAVWVFAAASVAPALCARADELRPAVDRPEVMEVGDPILVTRRVLGKEMTRNVELRDWVHLYGTPDYAEVQEVQIDPPFAPYEVRLYYLKRNAYLAFGRVNVAPNIYDYGVRKYIGPINAAVLDRLLTTPTVDMRTAPHEPEVVAPVAVVVETAPVEGVPVSN